MATTKDAILLRFGADVSSLIAGLKSSSKEMGAFKQSVGGVKDELIGLAAEASAGIGLAILAHEALEFADSLIKVHDQTGLATDTIQYLRFVAEQTGGSVDGLASMVSKMERQISAANEGNKEAIQGFTDMGLSVEDLRAMRPEDQFQTIALAIAAIPDEGDRAAAAVAAFGKSGADALPQIMAVAEHAAEMNAEFERTGGAVGDDAITKVDALGDSLAGAKTALVAMATEILADVAPALTSIAQLITEIIGGFRLLDGQGDNAIVNLDNKIADAEKSLEALKASAYSSFGGMNSAVADAITQQEALIATLKRQQEAQLGLGAAGAEQVKNEKAYQDQLAAAAAESTTALMGELQNRNGLGLELLKVRIEQEDEALNAQSAGRIAALQAQNEAEKAEAQAQADWLKDLQQSSNDTWAEMGQELSDTKIQTWQQETQGIAQLLQQQTEGVAQHSKAMFEINKAAGIVNTIINTVQAVVKAWSDYGWPVGAIVGAAVAAAGAAQVQAIASTHFGSKTAPSQAATPATPVAPAGGGGGGSQGGQTLRVEGISPDAIFTGKSVRALADRLVEFQKDGGQVVLA